MSTIEITAQDGHKSSSYCVKPKGAPRGGLVIIQEFFGVNGHIRRVCDQYAADGYLVLSPAIFDRVERNVELGYDEGGMNKARALRAKLNLDQIMLDVQRAIDAASSAGKVAALGYCWGGSLAYIAAGRLRGYIRAPSTASIAMIAASMSRRVPQSRASARCRSLRIMLGDRQAPTANECGAPISRVMPGFGQLRNKTARAAVSAVKGRLTC